MPTVTLQASSSCIIKPSAPSTHFTTGVTETIGTQYTGNGLLVSFEALPSNLRSKRIVSVDIYTYAPSSNNASQIITLSAPFDPATATYNSAAIDSGSLNLFSSNFVQGYRLATISSAYSSEEQYILPALKNGIVVFSYSQAISIETSIGSNPPYAVVSYEDATAYIGNTTPQSGYVPKTKASAFSWALSVGGVTYDAITQSSAVFRWRTAEGATPSETTLTTANTITVAANTFSTDSIQWQVTATPSAGTAITSPWYTLSTVEALSSATITEPIGSVVDGSKEILFVWQHIISTGTAQTKYDIETSADGTTYTSLHSETTAVQNYAVVANTFSAGALYWRVRTYNTDNAAGSWSSAKIVVIAAPSTPVVSVSSSPRPMVQWQATGQQAYEVEIGTLESGTKFGVEKSYKCPEYLADGIYTAKVRVQNQYGLWSEWGTASFTAPNTVGNAITLAATSSHVAALSWATTGLYDKYYVYRDGELIAKTTLKSYVDNTSIGITRYQVRGAYDASDNYGLSNSVTADVKCETVMIAEVLNPAWTTLDKTATSDRTNGITESCQASYVYFSGNTYASVEMSEFRTKKMNFETAFKDRESADNFSRLLGKLVCVKDQWNNMVIGVLLGFGKSSTRFYQSFTCEVEQIAYNEVISHD